MNDQILKATLSALAARRPVFHSEADFQHELAMEISRAGFDLRLEVPFSVNLNGHRVTVELDLLLIDRLTKQRAAVEVKYVKSAASIVHNGENFDLKHTWGTNLSRFDCLADFQRVGRLKAAGAVDFGFSIFLTNASEAWDRDAGKGRIMAGQFSIHDGRPLDAGAVFDWDPVLPSRGSVSAKRLPPYTPIIVPSAATCMWTEYSEFQQKNGRFRYLLLEA
jgi:hypothetical protein